ncbi:MAG: hypothetical protein D6675_15415 [Gemmatimonadetes bacterium]|nr:MAG: hypothetical protein D6675_15415 [Gemmatimonadota bacterium]
MSNLVNPYVTGTPLTSENAFYGREDIFQFIENALQNPSQNLIVIYGQRRIGKTSILNRLPHRLAGTDCHVVSCSLMGKAHYSTSQILAHIARTIAETVAGIDLPVEASFRQEDYFRREFLPAVFDHLSSSRLLVTFDEYDEFGTEPLQLPNSAYRTLFPYLQTLLQSEKRLVLLFALGHRIEELPPLHHGFFKSALVKVVPRLSPDEARRLISQAVSEVFTYDTSALKLIWKLTAGHPYFTQLIGSEVFKLAQREGLSIINADHVHSVLPAAMESGEAALAWMWDGLSRSERIVFSAMAHAADEDGVATLQDIRSSLKTYHIRLLETEISNAPKHLTEIGMLEAVSEDTYRFIVEFLRGWVFFKYPLENIHRNIDRENQRANRYFENAREAHLDGEFELAIEDYRRALKANPDHLGARLGLAQALYELGDYRDAIVEYNTAYQLDAQAAKDGLISAQLKYATQLEGKQNQTEAIELYHQVLDISPHERRAISRLSAIWMSQARSALLNNHFDEAMRHAQQVLEIDPDNLIVQQLMDEIKAQQKQYQIKQLANQIDRLQTEKNWESLQSLYRQLIDLEPDNPIWSESLADVEQEIRLGQLYQEAKTAHDNEEWARAEALWAQLYREKTTYVGHDGIETAILFAQAILSRRGNLLPSGMSSEQIQELNAQIAQLETENATLRQEYNQAQTQLEQLTRENRHLNGRITSLEQTEHHLAELQTTVTRLTQERDEALSRKAAVEEQLAELTAKVEQLTTENATLTSQTQQRDEWELRVQELETELAERTTERDQLQAAKFELEQRLQTAGTQQQRLEELTQVLQSVTAERDTAQEQQHTLQQQISELQQAQETGVATQTQLTTELETLKTRAAQMEDALNAAMTEQKELRDQLEQKTAELQALQSSSNQVAVLQTQLQEKQTEIDTLHQRILQLQPLQALLDQKSHEIEQLQAEIQALKTADAEEKTNYENQVVSLKSALQEKTEETTTLQKRLDELEAQVETLMQVPEGTHMIQSTDEPDYRDFTAETEVPPSAPSVEADLFDAPLDTSPLKETSSDFFEDHTGFEEQNLTEDYDFEPAASTPSDTIETADFEEQELDSFEMDAPLTGIPAEPEQAFELDFDPTSGVEAPASPSVEELDFETGSDFGVDTGSPASSAVEVAPLPGKDFDFMSDSFAEDMADEPDAPTLTEPASSAFEFDAETGFEDLTVGDTPAETAFEPEQDAGFEDIPISDDTTFGEQAFEFDITSGFEGDSFAAETSVGDVDAGFEDLPVSDDILIDDSGFGLDDSADVTDDQPDTTYAGAAYAEGVADLEEMEFMTVDDLFDHVSAFTEGLVMYNETRDFGVFERIYTEMDHLETLAQVGEFHSVSELSSLTKSILYRLHIGELVLDDELLDALHDAAEALTNLISGLIGEEDIDDESIMQAIRERFRDVLANYDTGEDDFEDLVVG